MHVTSNRPKMYRPGHSEYLFEYEYSTSAGACMAVPRFQGVPVYYYHYTALCSIMAGATFVNKYPRTTYEYGNHVHICA
jgi:hypothetical protein